MAAWPATLPAPIINTYSEELPQNTLRTQMEVGPAKTRRRQTANSYVIGYEMVLTEAQMTTLATFFNDTTLSGADTFTYTLPRGGAGVTARFAEPPQISDLNGQFYRAMVRLEIMP